MRLMLAALMALGCAAPAAAQNTLVDKRVITGVSADNVLALFTSAGMTGRIVGASGGDQLVELKSPEGFVMYVALSNCASQTSSASCPRVKPYAIFNASMALDSVNRFNYSSSSVSTLMMMPDGRLLLGVKLLLDGGVTETNLRTYLASYMFDVASLIEGPNDSAATNVAYDPQAAQGPAPGVVPAAGAQENSMDIDVAAIAGRAGTALAGVASED